MYFSNPFFYCIFYDCIFVPLGHGESLCYSSWRPESLSLSVKLAVHSLFSLVSILPSVLTTKFITVYLSYLVTSSPYVTKIGVWSHVSISFLYAVVSIIPSVLITLFITVYLSFLFLIILFLINVTQIGGWSPAFSQVGISFLYAVVYIT